MSKRREADRLAKYYQENRKKVLHKVNRTRSTAEGRAQHEANREKSKSNVARLKRLGRYDKNSRIHKKILTIGDREVVVNTVTSLSTRSGVKYRHVWMMINRGQIPPPDVRDPDSGKQYYTEAAATHALALIAIITRDPLANIRWV